MEKIIKKKGFELLLDEDRKRLFATATKEINVFDLNTWELVHSIEFDHPSSIHINKKLNILMVTGFRSGFAIYDLDTLELKQRFKFAGTGARSGFIFDEELNTAYFIGEKTTKRFLIKVDLNTETVEKYKLLGSEQKDNCIINMVYSLLSVENGVYKIIKSKLKLYTSGKYRFKNSLIEYRVENGEMKEKSVRTLKYNFNMGFDDRCGEDMYNSHVYYKSDTMEAIPFNTIFHGEYSDVINITEAKDGSLIFIVLDSIKSISIFKGSFENNKKIYTGKSLCAFVEYGDYVIIGTWEKIIILTRDELDL